MGIRSDAALAVILALGLHGAALALIAGRTAMGATAAGEGGVDMITLAPVAGDVASLIAAWEAPPEVTAHLPEALAEAAPDLSPPAPAPIAPPAPVTLATPLPQSSLALAPPPLAPPPLAPPEAALPLPTPEPAVSVNPDLHPKPRPTPRPAPPKRDPKPAPTPAAKAAGQGGGGAVGQAGQAVAGTANSAGAEDAVAGWGAEIRARIERKKTYPRAADGATGVVTLVITVTPQGALVAVSVTASSGNPVLDAAAVKAVQSARLPKGPAGIGAGDHSFRFRLRYEG